MRKSVLAAAVAVAMASGAIIGQASAADLDYMPAPAPAPPPFVPTWAGFYVGGHVGYGEGTADFRQNMDFDVGNDGTFDVFNTFRSGTNPDGIIGGVQGGYNWQWNSLVLGIEGDISFADWDSSSVLFDSVADPTSVDGLLAGESAFGTSSADIDFLASVRGRVGYALGNFMVFGTGGVAWVSGEADANIVFEDAIGEESFSGNEDMDDFGVVAGGGASYMIIPQTFSVGVEGLYYWFGESETLISDSVISASGDNVDVFAKAEIHDAWVVRARADFHF